jgi:hypothetical protein
VSQRDFKGKTMNTYNRLVIEEFCKLRNYTPGMKRNFFIRMYDIYGFDALNNADLFTIVFDEHELNGVKLVMLPVLTT